MRRRWRLEYRWFERHDRGTRDEGRRTLPAVVGRPPPLVPPIRLAPLTRLVPPTRVSGIRGHHPPPALRAGRALLPLSALPHVPGPRRAARRARPVPVLLRPAPGARPLSPRGLHGRPGALARR